MTARLDHGSVPPEQAAKIDRITQIAQQLPVAMLVDDWTVAVAHAIDTYNQSGYHGQHPVQIRLTLRAHNPALWAHFNDKVRDIAVAAYYVLTGDDSEPAPKATPRVKTVQKGAK